MRTVPENITQIFPTSSTEIPCTTYGCYTMSSYHMGRPDGPPNMRINLCTECARNLVLNLPKELMELLVVENEGCNCGSETVCVKCAEEKGHWVCDVCLRFCGSEGGLISHQRTHFKEAK